MDTGSDVCVLDTGYMEAQSIFDVLDGKYIPKPDAPYRANDLGFLRRVDLTPVSKACNLKVIGIIGKRYFLRHIIQIDYANNRFREVSKKTLEHADVGERFKLTIDHDHFYIQIDVAGKLLDKVLIDTGDTGFLTLDEKTAGELKLTAGKSQKITATSVYGVSEGVGYRPDSLQIHGVKFEKPKIAVFPATKGSDPAAVGNEFLSHYIVTIDADGGAMYLKPVEGPTTAATTQPAGRELNRRRK